MSKSGDYMASAAPGDLEACVEGHKTFEEVLRDSEWPTGWDFRPYQHWTEIFQPTNWKNFTLIAFEVEYMDAMRPPGYVEVHIGLLGFGIYVTRYGNASKWDAANNPITNSELDRG